MPSRVLAWARHGTAFLSCIFFNLPLRVLDKAGRLSYKFDMFAATVTDHLGKKISLPFKSGKTLICFFTKDRTPCCGRERRALCDKLGVLARQGVHVVGVTIDQVRDHSIFMEGCSVTYPMIVDRSFEVCGAFGVVRTRSYKGKSYRSILPNAYLLDAAGQVERVLPNFDLEHEALKVLESL